MRKGTLEMLVIIIIIIIINIMMMMMIIIIIIINIIIIIIVIIIIILLLLLFAGLSGRVRKSLTLGPRLAPSLQVTSPFLCPLMLSN